MIQLRPGHYTASARLDTQSWLSVLMHSSTAANRLAVGIFALSTLYAAAVLVWFPKWTVDDAYITYRYAENLARHGQLTWNVGRDPVEGYTGVALPVLLAAAIAAGADPDTASKTLGVTAMLLLAAANWSLCRRLDVGLFGRAITFAGLLTAPFMFTHALSGLETVPYTAFVLLSVERAIAIEMAPRFRRPLWLGFSASTLAVSLIRPEGFALSIFLFAASLLAEMRRHYDVAAPCRYGLVNCTTAITGTRRAIGVWIAVVAIPGTAYFVWRVWYYGQLLPNTFYAKLHTGFVADSLIDLAKFGVLYLAAPTAAVLVAIAAARGRTIHAIADLPWRTVVATAVFVTLCLTVYSRSALVMNFEYRFFVPFYPLVLIAAMTVVSQAWRVVPFGRARTTGVAVMVLFVAAQLVIHVVRLGRSARDADATRQLLTEEHRQVGMFLRDRLLPGDTIVVVVDAGVVPYVSGLRTVDFGGLNDEFLSHRFRRRIPKTEIADYFYASNPAALVFTSRVPDRIDGPEPIRVQDDPRFSNYVLTRVFSCETWPAYHQLVFLRRDVAAGGSDCAR